MVQIKTKAKLIEALSDCEGCLIIGSEKKVVFDHYSELIKSDLSGIKDDSVLPEYTSLKFPHQLMDFVGTCTEKELTERLNLIHHDLYEWREVFMSKAIVDMDGVIGLQNEAIQACSAYQQKRKSFMWYKIGMVVLIFVALAFTFMSFFKRFASWANYVAAIIGVLDFAFGILFQVLERKDDLKQLSKVQKASQEITEQEDKLDRMIVQNAKNITNNHYETHGPNSPIFIGGNGNGVGMG